MSLTTTSIILADGLKVASELWEDTRAGWDDPVAEAFETTYWQPLKSQVEMTLAALSHLAPVLARAREDCF
jgi:hypothetical protein